MLAIRTPFDTPTRVLGTVRFMSTIALSSGRSMHGHQTGAKSGSDSDEMMCAALAPWVAPVALVLLQVGVLLTKAVFFCWLFVWVRWTLPRVRMDQMMAFAWKVLTPLALLNVLISGWLMVQKG